MDFNDYTNQLNQSLNKENKSELETFYSINSDLLKYFKAIDKHIQALLSASNIDFRSIEELKGVLPTLNKLKFEINLLDANSLSDSYKAKINKTISYIKEVMLIAEVDSITTQFFDLLEKNEMVFAEEQEKRRKANAETLRLQQQQAEVERQRFEQEERKRNAATFTVYFSAFLTIEENVDIYIDDIFFEKQYAGGFCSERCLKRGVHKIKIYFFTLMFEKIDDLEFNIDVQQDIDVGVSLEWKPKKNSVNEYERKGEYTIRLLN